MNAHRGEISFDDFLKVDIRAGVIREAKINAKARTPAYELAIDFGELGMKKSSAQITQNYTCTDLIGTQIVAVVNFAPKMVAGVRSEVLVLAVVCPEYGTVLLKPTQMVTPGARVL
jgi:tRNA-binding protein